ncbi:MAG: 3'(2'),5'-bisphosphate nucleotidase CysQ [Candidatus Heimdallarchaeota archaeon]
MKDSLLKDVIEIAQSAGEMALDYFNNGYKTMKKGKNDVVTEADLAVDNFLNRELLKLVPEAGWLSEETKDDFSRLTKDKIWIIDPIDGTYQFTKGTNEWVVSIALIDNSLKQPILGVIYNPLLKELYSTELNKGVFLNGKKIEKINLKGKKNLTTTRSKRNLLNVVKNGLRKNHDIKQVGSIAYILALTASRINDAFITYKKVNEWDIAAGFLLLKEAGGSMNVLCNKRSEYLNENHEISFNKKDVEYKGIYGAHGDYYKQFEDLIFN